jgi:hypothetical protein
VFCVLLCDLRGRKKTIKDNTERERERERERDIIVCWGG